jgi:hypothetical protein
MTFIVKLSHKGSTRRLTFAEQPTWAVLAAKIAEVFRLNMDVVAVRCFRRACASQPILKPLLPGFLLRF